MEFYSDVIYPILNFLSVVLVGALALLALGVLALFVLDITQHKDAVRRNYPVLGRFHYLFSKLGEFFRQYFFAMDREEMPFNRAEREWIDKSSRGEDNTVAFGSTKNLTIPGTAIFVNCPFPTLDGDAEITPPVTIGPYCPEPYETSSIINISGMSYGAELSQPAARALSAGAKMAGCWMNTGEGVWIDRKIAEEDRENAALGIDSSEMEIGGAGLSRVRTLLPLRSGLQPIVLVELKPPAVL